jgi:hypothetical protein
MYCLHLVIIYQVPVLFPSLVLNLQWRLKLTSGISNTVFSPQNENFNLLVQIKFLNLFLYSSK